jgi:hypothetical protein
MQWVSQKETNVPTSAMTGVLRRYCVAAGLAFASLLLGACGEPVSGPEESLREWVAQGRQAADDKDRSSIVRMISPTYQDGRGNSRDDIEKLLRGYFFRMHDVALMSRIEELNIFGETAAELVLVVGMAATHDGTLGFSADAYRFEMELERQGDDWLLLGASWGELGGELR